MAGSWLSGGPNASEALHKKPQTKYPRNQKHTTPHRASSSEFCVHDARLNTKMWEGDSYGNRCSSGQQDQQRQQEGSKLGHQQGGLRNQRENDPIASKRVQEQPAIHSAVYLC